MSQPIDLSLEQNNRPRLSPKGKCNLAAAIVMILPALAWPLLALFVVGGCGGSLHAGIGCPRILGINFYSVPTDLLLFSVKGFALSIPLGLATLGFCRFVLPKHKR